MDGKNAYIFTSPRKQWYVYKWLAVQIKFVNAAVLLFFFKQMGAFNVKPERLKAAAVYLDLLEGLHCSIALMQRGQEPLKYGNTTNYPVKQPN